MMWKYLLVFFVSIPFIQSAASPAEHSVLNHTAIYFEEEAIWQTAHTELLVFVDSLYPGQKPVRLVSSRYPSFRLAGFSWGKEYFWRVKYFNAAGRQISISPMHHFYTQAISYLGKEEMRLRIQTNDSSKHQGGYISVDYTRSVFDRSGKPVWSIPPIDTLMDGSVQIRDLRMTEENTFTFLTGKTAMELDYDGKIIWKAPYPLVIAGDTIIYHHDFQKTNRGTYLVMGLRKIYRPMLGTYSEEQLKTADVRRVGTVWYQGTQMNILLELDRAGKVIWTWDASSQISDETLNYKKTLGGLPNFATHANAFGQSENPNLLYIGYRDLSRISEIDKKTGQVLKSFGEPYPGTKEKFYEADFRKQHGTFITDHETILLYNNNNTGPNEKTISSVMELDNRNQQTGPVVLWQFALDFDTLSGGKGVSGGNVLELKDGNIFVCAGTLNRIFEVNRQKEIVWDAFVEGRRAGQSWQAAPQYRANFKKQFSWHQSKVLIEVVDNKKQLQIFNSGTEDETYEIRINDAPSRDLTLLAGHFYSEELPADLQKGQLKVRLLSTNEVLPLTLLKK